ncbi:MAG: DUF433 domain-containing protein [Gammaproteobacteria bacterium]|nr:DUF433 domain-containing protein [Gammaproteobacteria bacterium]MYE84637.1 DUF433 domain-containing protein [Gammaproteobacteria bacterium]MYF11433.1 DUF433 domain-containing protein [Gammaproteobacteria bacterium]
MARPRTRPSDPRECPAYTVSEVAHYLTLPPATVRYWAVGRGGSAPLIDVPRRDPTLLSFLNLTELHVLTAIRRKHQVKMRSIRSAIEYLARNAQGAKDKRHPLISRELETDGLDLFIERYGKLINISKSGQTAMRQIIAGALRRIDRDTSGVPIKLYPFTRNAVHETPSMVVIDPMVSAGRPVISGTGLVTQLIAERYKAGESINDLANDYERGTEEIEEAIRCELQAAA